MKKTNVCRAVLVVGLCVVLFSVGCLGHNHATGRLFKFNVTSFENKWAQEGMFLLMFPAYALFSLGDNLVFNSIYWWTGNNPIDPPEGFGPQEVGL